MEPEELVANLAADTAAKLRPIVLVVWIALLTAIIVTVIDWKIKQDMLKIANQVYGPLGEASVPRYENNNHRRGDHNFVPAGPVVDSHPRVETQNATPATPKDPEDHSSSWSEFAPFIDTGLTESRADEDSGSVSPESE